ncbi:hypothetical protein J6590_000499 [Homalodisca vitripennis]|nr:hypothetical protein J6590_000499 [Homalodisca vitripennis]
MLIRSLPLPPCETKVRDQIVSRTRDTRAGNGGFRGGDGGGEGPHRGGPTEYPEEAGASAHDGRIIADDTKTPCHSRRRILPVVLTYVPLHPPTLPDTKNSLLHELRTLKKQGTEENALHRRHRRSNTGLSSRDA